MPAWQARQESSKSILCASSRPLSSKSELLLQCPATRRRTPTEASWSSGQKEPACALAGLRGLLTPVESLPPLLARDSQPPRLDSANGSSQLDRQVCSSDERLVSRSSRMPDSFAFESKYAMVSAMPCLQPGAHSVMKPRPFYGHEMPRRAGTQLTMAPAT